VVKSFLITCSFCIIQVNLCQTCIFVQEQTLSQLILTQRKYYKLTSGPEILAKLTKHRTLIKYDNWPAAYFFEILNMCENTFLFKQYSGFFHLPNSLHIHQLYIVLKHAHQFVLVIKNRDILYTVRPLYMMSIYLQFYTDWIYGFLLGCLPKFSLVFVF